MQIQSYTQSPVSAIPQSFCVVLFNHGRAKRQVILDNDVTFSEAMSKARSFPLMTHERLTVYRGVFGKDGGLRESYTRTGKRIIH